MSVDVDLRDHTRCRETVYVRDTWRYSGRGRGGFTLHYDERQCHRYVKAGDEYCWQHRRAALAAQAGGEGG